MFSEERILFLIEEAERRKALLESQYRSTESLKPPHHTNDKPAILIAGVEVSRAARRQLLPQANKHHARKAVHLRGPLSMFKHFCSSKTRNEVVQLAAADIRRTIKRMEREGRSVVMIWCVRWWHTGCCVASVGFDASLRVIKKVSLIQAAFNAISRK